MNMLTKFTTILLSTILIGQQVVSIEDEWHKLECKICTGVLTEIDNLLQTKPVDTVIAKVAELACEWIHAQGNCPKPFTSWQCQQLCDGLVHEYSPEVVPLYIMTHIDPNEICYKHGYHCPAPVPTVEPAPPAEYISDSINPPKNKNSDSNIGYFVQVPDIHWDPKYQENTNVNCGEPVCCRNNCKNEANTTVKLSGFYGSYGNCDTPTVLLQSMFDFMKNNLTQKYGKENIDFVIWVGDGPAHDIWNESSTHKMQILTGLTDMFNDTFPGMFLLCLIYACS